MVRYTEDFVMQGFVISRFHCTGFQNDRAKKKEVHEVW